MASAKTASANKPLLLLMDGHAMVHRSWHAIQQPLTINRTGEEVHGVYGFLNTFLRTLADFHPTHCAISFDLSGPTFRHLEYDEYKAQRPRTPDELRAQFPHVRRFMEVFGVPTYEQQGYEADDVLGTLCRQAEEHGIDALVLTGDTDELQLVSPNVKLLLTTGVQGRTVYDVDKVRERYDGLGPEAVPDIKALEGDTSDNIPGVPGVGKKTAIKLLTEFGSVEGILENLDEVSPPRVQKNLAENRELALRGKFLTTIVRDVPVELDLDATRFWTYDRAKIVEALREFEFFSMVDRIPSPDGDTATATQATFPMDMAPRNTHYTVVDTPEALDSLVKELTSSGGFAFDAETTAANAMSADLVGIAFSNAADHGWYVPLGHDDGRQLPLDDTLATLRPVLEDESVPKIAHDASHDMTMLSRHGINVKPLAFDTMLAAHAGGRKATVLKSLALELLQVEVPPVSDLIGSGRKQVTMAQVAIDQATGYVAGNADLTYQLYGILDAEVEQKGVKNDLDTVEMPMIPALVRMQANGIALNVGLLKTMSVDLAEKVAHIESGMYELVGHEFNIGSSQQLGDVLFKELGLPPTKRTQKGYSTDASSLEGLKHVIDRGETEGIDPKALEVLEQVLEYRQLTKIKSTYVDALPSLVNPRTGRIHTIYNQTGSATGRVSSNDPNVQNIPIRTDRGRDVRRAFIAEEAPDWTLLAADYSQIELRVLAHLSEDPGLVEAFRSGQDIHDATASSVYGVHLGEVTADMRRVAKIMNFGVVYGLSPFGISRQTGLTAEEGKEFTEAYFGKYLGIRDYIDSIKARVRETGYVETLNGRRRYIPEIGSSNFQVRSSGERMAINMPIQGTAADILKIAMAHIQVRLDELKLRTMMVVQVHDELIFETPQDELDTLKDVVLELMPSAMDLVVPLDIELKSGDTWGDME